MRGVNHEFKIRDMVLAHEQSILYLIGADKSTNIVQKLGAPMDKADGSR